MAPLNEPPPAPPQRALVEQIAERGAQLRSRIADLTDRDVAVVCVTKGHPVEVAAAAVAAGFTRLGENYAQELRDKAAALIGPTPEWHFIGRLQTNKVRLVDRVVSLWQSVDRAALADRIAQRVPGAAVLVQVDLAGLAGRGGCPPEDVPALVEHCRGRGLDVRGLMGVGPPGPAEEARPGFRLLTSIADDLGLEERSMGMSGDLDVAIEAGSTMVRVGSALVGPRAPR